MERKIFNEVFTGDWWINIPPAGNRVVVGPYRFIFYIILYNGCIYDISHKLLLCIRVFDFYFAEGDARTTVGGR